MMQRKRYETTRSREETVHLVRKYDEEFPTKYYETFLEYIRLSDGEFGRLLTNSGTASLEAR